nr:hypothetical protein [Tanacetum cinerariifolium]
MIRRMHQNRGKIAELDADKDVTLVDAEKEIDADVQGRLEESQEKVYHLDLEHAEKVLSMQDTNAAEPAEVKKVIKVVTAAKLMTEVVTTTVTTITVAQVPKASAPRRKKGVVIHDPEETATASDMMILLMEKKYPLTRFTLEQMLNNVRLEVEEESEMSLELLSFEVDVVEDFKNIC